MTVYVLGSPYWRKYLASGLRSIGVSHAGEVGFTTRELTAKMRGRPAAVLIVGVGAQFSLKRAVIWSWLLGLRLLKGRGFPLLFYWIGSDVLTLADPRSARMARWLTRRLKARHICGAPWLVDRLAAAGLDAEPVLFPYDTSAAETKRDCRPPAAPFRICTYLNAPGWNNLRGDLTLEVASRTPDIEWTVFGMRAKEMPGTRPCPPNVRFLGWVEDPLNVVADHHAFMRLARHDAYSGVVRDAQAMGRIVFYTMPVENVIHIADLAAERIAEIVKAAASGPATGSNASAGPSLPPYAEQIRLLATKLAVTAWKPPVEP